MFSALLRQKSALKPASAKFLDVLNEEEEESYHEEGYQERKEDIETRYDFREGEVGMMGGRSGGVCFDWPLGGGEEEIIDVRGGCLSHFCGGLGCVCKAGDEHFW